MDEGKTGEDEMSVDEQKREWRNKALGGLFFGQPIAELDRDGLLAVIGCLQSSVDMERQLRTNERETWAALSADRVPIKPRNELSRWCHRCQKMVRLKHGCLLRGRRS